MSHQVAHTSATERQHLRQNYYTTSEQEAGLAHLWHMQRLASIRLSPSHTIQDVPDVDFQQPGRPSMDYYRQLYADRYAQQVRHDEAQIYAQNVKVLHHLLLASDDTTRKGRHMNLVPTSSEVCRFDNIEDQTLSRMRQRQTRQRQIAQENEKFLGHLLSVSPRVRTAKDLGEWHTTVHKKRVQQLSRFKPAEPFAGARLLEAASSRRRSSHGGVSGAAATAAAPYSISSELAAAPPLLRGHPYPPLSIAEASRTAPASLLPVVRTTSYGGVPLVLEDSIGSLGGVGNSEAATAGYAAVLHHPPKRPPGTSRPDWQPISATDISLLHYAADLQLRRDGGGGTSTCVKGSSRSFSASSQRRGMQDSMHDARRGPNASGQRRHKTAFNTVRLVEPTEEGGVTQIWRHALRRRHERLAAEHTDHGSHTTLTGKPFTHRLPPQFEVSVGGAWEANNGCFVQCCPSADRPARAPPLLAPQVEPAAESGNRLAPTAPPAPVSGYPRRPLSSSGSALRAPVQSKWRESMPKGWATSLGPSDSATAAKTADAQMCCASSCGAYAPI
ncbi:hypothetical protein Q4I30_004105 [Leishmania utingensis]|uniref:Uncharacterized protein n=1 Tax=Leishmania utingensis TaxID=653362 RepID=A0AAW3AF93_9TRYP